MQLITRTEPEKFISANAAIEALRLEFAEKFQAMAGSGMKWDVYAIPGGIIISHDDPLAEGHRRSEKLLENAHSTTVETLAKRLKWKMDDRCPTIWIDQPRDCALHKLIAEKLSQWPENIDMICVSKRSEWMFRHRVTGIGSVDGQLDRAIKEIGRCSPLYRSQYCTEEQFLAMRRAEQLKAQP